MSINDHFIAFLICILFPLYDYWSFLRDVNQTKKGKIYDRLKDYNLSIIRMWLICIFTLVYWNLIGYDPSDLGLKIHMNFASWIIVLIIICLIIFFLNEVKKTKSMTDEQNKEIFSNYGDLIHFLPQTKKELNQFYFLSVTAGIVEELMYRAFLLWYTSQIFPFWLAILSTVFFFGFAHLYQGKQNMVKTAVIGALFMTIYLVTESLVLPIILHALFDISQGKLAYDMITRQLEIKK